MKTVFIAIAFGTSIRDVLRNDTYRTLRNQKNVRIVLFIPKLDEAIIKEFGGDNVFIEQLYDYVPSILERILRHLIKATLRSKSATINLGNVSGDKRVLNYFTPFAKILKKVLGYNSTINLIKEIYKKTVSETSYQEYFEKYKPDLVILSRVLNYSLDYPLLKCAYYNKISSICLVSSWDNLTGKGFIPYPLEALVVWNSIMKEEAIELFDITEKNIYVTGIPRFDTYEQDKNCFRRKSDFFEFLDIPSYHKLITYSTGSKQLGRSAKFNSTPEPLIVDDIASAIQGNQFGRDVSLLLRLHPQADMIDYQHLIQKYEFLKIYIPGKTMGFRDRVFDKNEDFILAETLMHSDVIVNFASTMTIDAAAFDCPTICVSYDSRKDIDEEMKLSRVYQFEHYRKLIEIGNIQLATDKELLIDMLKTYLLYPENNSEDRENIVDKFCYLLDGKAGFRTANFILRYLKEGKRIFEEVN